VIVELTPETYFESVTIEVPLHVVMHYGATCGPCKRTMPIYETVYSHFLEHKVTNVKFYRFHQWEQSYKEFIEVNNLKTSGVPTFKYFYFGELVTEQTKSYSDANLLKKDIIEVIQIIEKNIGEFDLYATN
jgi:thiol-disulfide isomerase/thioredoxin